MVKSINVPTLFIHATPPFYGTELAQKTEKFINEIKINSNALFESVFIEGSHHLHMIKVKETSSVILNFLEKLKSTPIHIPAKL